MDSRRSASRPQGSYKTRYLQEHCCAIGYSASGMGGLIRQLFRLLERAAFPVEYSAIFMKVCAHENCVRALCRIGTDLGVKELASLFRVRCCNAKC